MSDPSLRDSLQGQCLCGAVRYRVDGTAKGFQYCHCSRCRKFTGSAHAANMFVRPDALTWTQGEPATFTLESDPPFPTAFCSTCGSSMPAMSSTGRFWVIPAGTVEGDPGARPQRSIFWGSKAEWYAHVSELPIHEEMPED